MKILTWNVNNFNGNKWNCKANNWQNNKDTE